MEIIKEELNIETIEERAAVLTVALSQLRKWSFILVQDTQQKTESEQYGDALIAACALIGIEPIAANMKIHAVSHLAKSMLKNAIPFPDLRSRILIDR